MWFAFSARKSGLLGPTQDSEPLGLNEPGFRNVLRQCQSSDPAVRTICSRAKEKPDSVWTPSLSSLHKTYLSPSIIHKKVLPQITERHEGLKRGARAEAECMWEFWFSKFQLLSLLGFCFVFACVNFKCKIWHDLSSTQNSSELSSLSFNKESHGHPRKNRPQDMRFLHRTNMGGQACAP